MESVLDRQDNKSGSDQAAARAAMVDNQIVRRGVKDSYVLEAMRSVPREAFMPPGIAALAYEDMAVPIGEGQTISQPFIVARMAELAELGPTDKVLEIGTGSGYGAAILGQIAGEVYTIERHSGLAHHARKVIEKHGYDNITILEGDGTQGLPDHAPFDAIIVTAGAPGVPEILQEQLAPDGRLVIPAGRGIHQQLLQIRRTGAKTFETKNCGAVTFVPLIGQYGWPDEKSSEKHAVPPAIIARQTRVPHREKTPARILKEAAQAIPDPTSPHFARHFSHLGTAQLVLLGEATHGTAEFYRARAALTQYLVREHGFNIIALEADWPDVATLDGYVRQRPVPDIGGPAFARFPEWMWRNEEFMMLVRWLHGYNRRQEQPENKAGLYGLDLYSLQASILAVVDFLRIRDPELAEIAAGHYGCFKPWLEDPAQYGRTILTADFLSCEDEALEVLRQLMQAQEEKAKGYEDAYLDALRNARTVVQAEQYYRAMYRGSAESWNLRDRHMFETLQAVMKARGPQAKAIVWAHNSHLGDARATEMGESQGELNLGQLVREEYGEKARLVGFGTAAGTVAAASHWGGPLEIKTLRPPLSGSLEQLWAETGLAHAHLDIRGANDEIRNMLERPFIQRAVGVIYRPQTEIISHYYDSHPARQFDDYIWFRDTNPVTPLPPVEESGTPDTYPFGL